MAAPTNADELVDVIRKSKLVEPARLDAYLTTHPGPHSSPSDLAKKMLAAGLLTQFHVDQLLRGKHRGYFLGKYKLLERIGMGGMGQVFLAEHTSMRRRAALKVLPPDMAADEFARERFMREARAVGQLDHPNLVKAFDVDSDQDVVFLVMEYIEGITLHDLVAKFGPLDPARAAHYLWQAACALSYISMNQLVHRDIKPANLIVDRMGVVKLLDLGLVRDVGGDNDLTRGQGVKILGTADYLAPEQAVDCSNVDIRADIYSLGATGYFLLTGKPPYPGDKVAQKLIAHQTKPIPQVVDHRADMPAELQAVLNVMLGKKPAHRYQSADELVAALQPWGDLQIAPPTDVEIPATIGMTSGNPASAVNLGSHLIKGIRSAASAAHSGSAIRYHMSDSNLTTTPRPAGGSNLRPPVPRTGAGSGRMGPAPAPPQALPTPAPTKPSATPSPIGTMPSPPVLPLPQPAAANPVKATPDSPGEFFAPILPAAVSYAGPLPVEETPALNPFKSVKPVAAPVPTPEPEPAKPPKKSWFRRWFSMALACSLTMAVAAWDVMLLTGGTARSAAPESLPSPAPSSTEAPLAANVP